MSAPDRDPEQPQSPAGDPDRSPTVGPAPDPPEAAQGRFGAPPGAIRSGRTTDPVTGRRVGRRVSGAAEDVFWRRSFAARSYTDAARGYEHYRPAYRFGWESRQRHPGQRFPDVESALRREWDAEAAGLDWERAKPAVRDAFERPANTELSDPGNPLA